MSERERIDDVAWRVQLPTGVARPHDGSGKLFIGLGLLGLMLFLMATGHLWSGIAVLFLVSWLGL